MAEISKEKMVESKQESIKNSCEYQGELYFVLRDISNGKCFIEVNGERKYLDKNGCVVNKQCGLRNYMLCAFGKILDAKDETNPVELMKLYNQLLDGLEMIAK